MVTRKKEYKTYETEYPYMFKLTYIWNIHLDETYRTQKRLMEYLHMFRGFGGGFGLEDTSDCRSADSGIVLGTTEWLVATEKALG